MPRTSPRRTAVAFLLAGALALPAAVRPAEPRVIELVARRFQFTPGHLTLRKDEPVILRLRTADVAHGLLLRPLGLDVTIEPGKVIDVPLTPHQAGTFRGICDRFCGAGHGSMGLTVEVQ